MTYYVVRGPNWRIDIKITEAFDDPDYEYVEAATRAIEEIYNKSANLILTDSSENAKFSSLVQVSKHEHDIPIPIPPDEKTPELVELSNIYVREGFIRFLFAPMVLANAGRFGQAEFLKSILENDQS